MAEALLNQRLKPEWKNGGLEKIKLKLPPAQGSKVEILGKGKEAAPKVVEMLQKLGVLS